MHNSLVPATADLVYCYRTIALGGNKQGERLQPRQFWSNRHFSGKAAPQRDQRVHKLISDFYLREERRSRHRRFNRLRFS